MVTARGRETMITCEPSSSVVRAPARCAMDRTMSAPAALSPVPTTAQDGRLFQAGGPSTSVKAGRSDGPLGGGHDSGLIRGQVGGEGVVEQHGIDR